MCRECAEGGAGDGEDVMADKRSGRLQQVVELVLVEGGMVEWMNEMRVIMMQWLLQLQLLLMVIVLLLLLMMIMIIMIILLLQLLVMTNVMIALIMIMGDSACVAIPLHK
jgi:hypothetical protein